MKKYLPIFLAFQILVTSSPNNQGMETLLKMGKFFHHFAHHIICHQENIGIVGFVKLHYFDHKHHEEDHVEHENLPFQHHHHDQQNPVAQIFCLLPHRHFTLALPKLKMVSNHLIVHSQQWHSSLYSGDIWQPPKAKIS